MRLDGGLELPDQEAITSSDPISNTTLVFLVTLPDTDTASVNHLAVAEQSTSVLRRKTRQCRDVRDWCRAVYPNKSEPGASAMNVDGDLDETQAAIEPAGKKKRKEGDVSDELMAATAQMVERIDAQRQSSVEEMNAYTMEIRTSVLNRFWRVHILDKYGLRGDMLPYVRRPFAAPFAMAVLDKVEGWNEEKLVGSYLAACMWINTKAVLCGGRRRDPPLDLQPTLGIIVESVSWATEDFLWEHDWITETKFTMKENLILEALNYDIDVPCPLQWGLLWFSAPTNFNRKFVNNGTKVAKFRETVNSAIESTCKIAFDGAHIPRALFFCGQ